MLELKKASAFLITDRIVRKYFSGVDIAEGTLILCENPTYFTDSRYIGELKEKLKGNEIVSALNNGKEIEEFIKEQKIETLYIDYTTTVLNDYIKYKKFGVKIEDGRYLIDECRSVKNKGEIKKIKKACSIIEKAYYNTLPFIREGVSELEIKDILEKECRMLGANETSFDTIVAFGKNSAVPHHETGKDKLKKNMPVLIDAGVKVDGYASDFTRTAFFGTPTEKFIRAYNAVLFANLKAEEEITDNIMAKKADAIARDYLEKEGYGEYFTHSLGHGVGLEIHEFPYISKVRRNVLKNGNVFTIEPGVYLDNEFGIRIEDTVLLENGKVKRLFKDDKKLKIIK